MNIEEFSKFVCEMGNNRVKNNADDNDGPSEDAIWEDSESLLDVLATNATCMPVLVCLKDGKGIFDTGQCFLAAEQTLLLIKQAYLQGNLIDAHLLLRRLFELIIQYIFFASLKKKKQYPSESLDQTEMTSDEKLDDFYRFMDQMQFDDSSLTDWSFFHQWAAGNPMGAAEKKKRRGFLSLKYYLDKIKLWKQQTVVN